MVKLYVERLGDVMMQKKGFCYWLYSKAEESILILCIVVTIINVLLGLFIQQITGIEWYEGVTVFYSGIKLPMAFACFICLEFIFAIFWTAIEDKYKSSKKSNNSRQSAQSML